MPAQPYNVSSTLEDRLKGRRAALDALRTLPEDYQLYYKPSLRGKDAADHADPAVDYIIAHKTKGLLGIAVKSGEIVEEPGGFISQYQPQKQLYKIIDPIKPAELALRALLGAFDEAEADRLYPAGVAVLFPDTARHEFASPKPNYLFAEDMAALDVPACLDALFAQPADSGDQAKFRANFNRLADFLKGHSDNAALFEADKRLKLASEAKKATPPIAQSQIRMKVAAAQGLPTPEAAPPQEKLPPPPVEQAGEMAKLPAQERLEKARAEKQARLAAQNEKALVAAALKAPENDNDLAIRKAEKRQPDIAVPAGQSRKRTATSLRAAPPQASRQKDIFVWMEEIEQKGEGDAMLTTTQWLMIAGVAVAIICAVYFMARNFAIATAAG